MESGERDVDGGEHVACILSRLTILVEHIACAD